jgi:hypothetical protein
VDDLYLSNINDQRDKLKSKLFKYKTRSLLSSSSICKCLYCESIYSENHNGILYCKNTIKGIDFNGNLIQSHSM